MSMLNRTSDQEQARHLKDSGSAALSQGKMEAALDDFREAAQLVPQDVSARRKLAEILVRLDRKQEAIAEYRHLVGRYAAEGQLLQAMAVCKVILQLQPDHTATQKVLADLYAKKSSAGRWIDAIPPNMAGALDLRHVRRSPVGSGAAESLTPTPQAPVQATGIDLSHVPPTPLFSDLPAEAFISLLNEVGLVAVPAGTRLISEGTRGTSMFILVQGAVNVVRSLADGEQRVVDRMKEGDFFGEMCLLTDAPRLASVVTEQDCLLLELTREMIQKLTARFPSIEPVMQQFSQQRLMANLLRSGSLFQPLSAEQKQALMERFRSRTVEPGTVLLRQGEQGDGLHVLLRGRCQVVHEEPTGEERAYPEAQEGAVLGEFSLLLHSGATATVRAATRCLVLTLDRGAFEELILGHPEARRRMMELSSQRLRQTAELLAGRVGLI